MSANKRNFLTLKEKMEIINTYDKERVSVRALANRFKIGKTQVGKIIKQKEEYKAKWQSGSNINEKRRFFKAEGLNVDKFCYDWFAKARSKGIPISGPIIKSKAKEIAEGLGYHNFHASDGWLHRFRTRHNISFKCISGEEASVNADDVTQFFEKIPSLLLGKKS